jgi:hypothetical protein
MVWQIAVGVALGLLLYHSGVFIFRKIVWVAFVNWIGRGHHGPRVELVYYPWEGRLRPDDPNYISPETYWFSLKGKT